QNSGTSASLSTRSRLTVALRSTPRAGLLVSNSCFVAHVKIADADASTWLATMGASILLITERTSALVMVLARSAPHAGNRWRRTRWSACCQLLFLLLAYSST